MKCHVILALVASLTEASPTFSGYDVQAQDFRLTRPRLSRRNPGYQGPSGTWQTALKGSRGKSAQSSNRFGSPLRGSAPVQYPKTEGGKPDAVVSAELKGPSRATVAYGNNILRPVTYSSKRGETKSVDFEDKHKVTVSIENGPGGKASLVGTGLKGSTRGVPEKKTSAQSVSEAHSQAGLYQYSEAKNGETSRAKGYSGDPDSHVLLRGGLDGQGTMDMMTSNSPERERERRHY